MIECVSHLYGNDSSIFLAICVKEIGLKSVSASRASTDFGAGMTFADFQSDGIKPSRIEELKMEHNGWQRDEAFSRRSHAGISSGPADEWGLDVFTASLVSATVMWNSAGNSSIGRGDQSKDGRDAPTSTNLSLSKLARVTSDTGWLSWIKFETIL